MNRIRRTAWTGTIVMVASITACVGPPLILTPTTLENAVEGVNYETTLTTEDSTQATWTVVEGDLPPGMTLERSGVLSGTPTAAGTYDFRVRASRFPPQRTGEESFSLTVLPRLEMDVTLPEARVGVAYDYTPTITGGVPPYTVDVLGLPGGMQADPATGRITGTPAFDSTGLPIMVNVTDSGVPQQTASDSGTLVIKPRGVDITTESLPSASLNTAYSTQVRAQDGRTPYVWTVVAGVLPAGLRLTQSTGVISGTPTNQSETEEFVVRVTDSDTPPTTDEATFKLVVPVELLSTSLPAATVNQTYEEALSAVAGLPPYTWVVVSGQLPSGLVLDVDSGLVFGTLAAGAQTQTFTVRVTDSDTPATSQERQYTITVNP